jgi:hypothetical protein
MHPLVTAARAKRPVAPVLLGALALVLLALGLAEARRSFIGSWFVRGTPQPSTTTVSHRPPSGPVRPVRVLLIDGLSEWVARTLPAYDRVCRAGLELRVDVGFPSVSLPVQHVLWTGTWQSESGVLFQIARMRRPVFESLPELVARRSSRAVAVAECHREIAASFLFSEVVAPPARTPPLDGPTLERESLRAARSDAGLVLIHVLATDKAGHRSGSAGAAYRTAARRADALLEKLWQARAPQQTLLVLADHGHLPLAPGGHGGTEPEIRWVRACLAGPEIAPGSRGTATLVDLTRILADRLNVAVPRHCQGRPLSAVVGASRAPQPQLPQRPTIPLALGLLIGLVLLWAARYQLAPRSADERPSWRWAALILPWGMALSLLLLVADHGPPSLSRFYVYPAYPRALLGELLPALGLPLLQLWTARRLGLPPLRSAVALAAVTLAPAVVVLSLTGWPFVRPALWPHVSAWASTLVLLAAASCVGIGVALVGAAYAASTNGSRRK